MISIILEHTKSSQQATWLQYMWRSHMSIMWPSTHNDHVMMSHDFNFIWYPYQSCDYSWQQTTVHSTCGNVTWVSYDLACDLISLIQYVHMMMLPLFICTRILTLCSFSGISSRFGFAYHIFLIRYDFIPFDPTTFCIFVSS